MSFKAPIMLGRAIKRAKTQLELKPLIEVYAEIYGGVPDELCALYASLPGEFKPARKRAQRVFRSQLDGRSR